jgi:Tfp pilus assembly protein PilO
VSGSPHSPWRKRLLPVFLALGLVNVAAAVAYTFPRGLRQRGIAARAKTLRTQVEQARQSVAELERRADIVRENTVAEKRLLDEVLSTRRAGLVPTLSEIERLAAEPGLEAGGRSFSPEPLKELPLLRLGVSVSLTGGYGQLVSFLRGLEGSEHFITVDQVQLRERKGEGGDSSEGALSVQLSAWFRADGEADAR